MGQISFVLLFCFSDFQNFTRFSFYHQIDQVFIIVLILIFRLFWPFSDFQIFRFSDFQIFRFSDFQIFRFSDFLSDPRSSRCLVLFIVSLVSSSISPLLRAEFSKNCRNYIIRFLDRLDYFFIFFCLRKGENHKTKTLQS
jgi:hypothetical protein